MAQPLMPTDATLRGPLADDGASAASWGAIAAGALAATALSLLLVAFGAGMGFSSVSPWSGSGVSGTTAGLVAGIYLLCAAALSSTVGGFIAGRLRTRWAGLHSDEVYFRDTAHGFLAWALATCVTVAFLTSAVGSIIGGVSNVAASAAGGAAANSSPTAFYSDSLLRPSQPGAAPTGDVAGAKTEVAGIMARALSDGALSSDDRTYLTSLIAARTGLSQADAQKRIDDTVTRAKSAADAARKTAAHFSLWLTASLFLGAFCASLAAIEGGKMRDD